MGENRVKKRDGEDLKNTMIIFLLLMFMLINEKIW